jgi:hypothetical protein
MLRSPEKPQTSGSCIAAETSSANSQSNRFSCPLGFGSFASDARMSLEISHDDQAVESARVYISNAISALTYLSSPQQASVENTVSYAINAVMMAALCVSDIHAAAPDLAETADKMFFAACPVVAEAVEPMMPAGKVYFLMGAVGGLLKPQTDEFASDRFNYAGTFAAKLAFAHHDRALASRGLPYLRAIRIQRALEAPMPEDGQRS